ncbi:TPA: fibrinogen-binding adhesin SdrG C-terminal domain-containing protein, partial [Staphylococcus aureus]
MENRNNPLKKVNKYSIRKIAVGTTSLMVGSLIYLGVESEAKAAEIDSPSSQPTSVNEGANKPSNLEASNAPVEESANKPSNLEASNAPVEEGANKPSNLEASNAPVEEGANKPSNLEASNAPVEEGANKPSNLEASNAPVEESANKPSNLEASNAPVEEDANKPSNLEASNAPVEEDANKPAKEEISTSKNVNDKVSFGYLSLDRNTINPNNGEVAQSNLKVSVDDSVKGGDYFTFQIPKYVSLNGDTTHRNTNNIMTLDPIINKEGVVLANGEYNTETKIGKYTFTDAITKRRNVKTNFVIPLFGDRESATKSQKYTLDFDFAGEKFTENLNIDYGDKFQGEPGKSGANITSNITHVDVDSGKNEYTQTIYVNAKQNNLKKTNVSIIGFHTDNDLNPLPDKQSSALINSNDTHVKIYKVNDATQLSDSYHVDPNDKNLIDVTKNFTDKIKYLDGNKMEINFGDINDAYVIVLDSHFDNSNNDLMTTVAEGNYDERNNFSGFKWTNDIR